MFSSVGLERYLDRVEVTGSNPVTPTKVPEVSGAFSFSFSELLPKNAYAYPLVMPWHFLTHVLHMSFI